MLASLRTTLLCFFILALTLVSATTIPVSQQTAVASIAIDDGQTQTPASHRLVARAGTTLCFPFTVILTVANATQATIRERTCYCNINGALTPASNTDINNAFAVGSTAINQTAFSSYLNTNSITRAQGITNVKNSLTAALNGKTTTCTYPAGVTPTSCTSCSFTCPVTGQRQCGTTCIAQTAACTSAAVVRRDIDTRKCQTGWDVCETGLIGFGGKSVGWECVNTQADLESCGGCARPTEGGKVGVDCTAIVGANGVACVSGSCQVASCLRGFKLVNNACEPLTQAASSIVSAVKARPTVESDFVQMDVMDDVIQPLNSAMWTEEIMSAKGQHKVWHKRTKVNTKSQRRR